MYISSRRAYIKKLNESPFELHVEQLLIFDKSQLETSLDWMQRLRELESHSNPDQFCCNFLM